MASLTNPNSTRKVWGEHHSGRLCQAGNSFQTFSFISWCVFSKCTFCVHIFDHGNGLQSVMEFTNSVVNSSFCFVPIPPSRPSTISLREEEKSRESCREETEDKSEARVCGRLARRQPLRLRWQVIPAHAPLRSM